MKTTKKSPSQKEKERFRKLQRLHQKWIENSFSVDEKLMAARREALDRLLGTEGRK